LVQRNVAGEIDMDLPILNRCPHVEEFNMCAFIEKLVQPNG